MTPPSAWAKPFFWRSALLCLPAIPLLLIGGDAWHQPVNGVIAAGAALSVGFGAARTLHGRRWGAMFAATICMAVAAAIGSLAGHSTWLLLPCAALGAALCATLALVDDDLWWVSLQTVIAFLVAGYFPADASAALGRAAVTFGGGAFQVVCVIVLAALVPAAAAPLPPGPPLAPRSGALIAAHAGRAALCVALSLAIARALQLDHSYWAPMTALLVIKPGQEETRQRNSERLIGTLVGCAAATLFVIAARAQPPALILGLGLAASLTFGLQRARYASMTAGVTAAVVLLNSLGGANVAINAEHRLLETLIGGLSALIVSWGVRRDA